MKFKQNMLEVLKDFWRAAGMHVYKHYCQNKTTALQLTCFAAWTISNRPHAAVRFVVQH